MRIYTREMPAEMVGRGQRDSGGRTRDDVNSGRGEKEREVKDDSKFSILFQSLCLKTSV